METEMDNFRQLVSNRYMPGFSYRDSKYSFKTVFHKSAYSYCCCPCAFDHEYMGYLSDDGTVNDNLLDSVISNVINGQCPHVTDVPEMYRKKTRIGAIHIVAAVATEKAIKDHIRGTTMSSWTSIFHITPPALAVMKNDSETFKILASFTQVDNIMHSSYNEIYLYATQPEHGISKVTLQKVYLIELAAMKNNAKLVKNILCSNRTMHHMPAGLEQALKFAIKNELNKVLSVLIEYIHSFVSFGKLSNALFCSKVAIVLNRPDILETFFKALPVIKAEGVLKYWLHDTCCILGRQDCRKLIFKYDTSAVEDKSPVDILKYIHLLETFDDDCKDIAIAALRGVVDTQRTGSKILHGIPRLHRYLDPYKRLIDTRVLSTMFDLGLIDINSVDEQEKSTFTHFLENNRGYSRTYKNFVAVLKTLIHENPIIEEEETAIKLPLKIDSDIHVCQSEFRWCRFEDHMEGNYEMDQKIHSVFDDGNLKATNFVTPILIECGFKAKGDLLQNAISGGKLHEEELGYLQNHLGKVRPLMLRCRDALRKHYVGRALHKFLDTQTLPKRIKDLILIKWS